MRRPGPEPPLGTDISRDPLQVQTPLMTMENPTPDRAAALKRLNGFVAQAAADYARLRNFDLGQHHHSHVSRLSPYIRHRLLLEQEVLEGVLARHSAAAVDKFVQEVFWRTYFKGWLEQHTDVWRGYRAAVSDWVDRLDLDSGLRERYSQAVGATTGIDCFDGWVRELTATGYLHNHARMWFASIWVFTLELPWQLGADFFYRQLLDGDPASNTLGWRWVCGLHTKGKTYLARASNIAKFTNGRCNPIGQLAVHANALVEPRDAAPNALPARAQQLPTQPYGLLVTSEDCQPESLPLGAPPAAIAAVTAAEDRSPLPVSPAVRAFSAGAVRDALARAERAFDRPGRSLESRDWGEALAAWAKREGVTAVVTAYAPVGPVAEQLARARARLEHAGIELIEVMRDFDRRAWPHAGRGFFKLKRAIPGLLDQLNLALA